MVAVGVSENESEEFQNLSHIEDLARELGTTVEEILFYYEAAMKDLRPNARIKAFLPILAGRQVREIVLEKKYGAIPMRGSSTGVVRVRGPQDDRSF